METRIVIETGRADVILRQFVPQDAEMLFWLIDRNREHLSQHDDRTSVKYPNLESVRRSIVYPVDPSRLRFGIWANGLLVGTVNLMPLDDEAEIGYWIAAQHSGRGYVAAAVEALVQHAFGALRMKSIFANIHQANQASLGVVERAGFRFDGPAGSELLRYIRTNPNS